MAGEVRRRRKAWFVRVYAGRDASGRRRWATRTIHGGRRDAEKVLHALLNAKAEQRLALPENITVAAFLEKWLQDHAEAVAPTTHDGYCMIVRTHLIPALGHVRLDRLTPAMIQECLRQQGHGNGRRALSASTRRKHFAVLHRALRAAVRRGVLAANPCDRADAPRPSRFEAKVWDAEQTQVFLGEAKRTSRYYRLYLAAVLTGARQGELLGLRWEDFDATFGRATIRQTLYRLGGRLLLKPPKTDTSRRTLPLPPVLVNELLALRDAQAARRRMIGDCPAGLACRVAACAHWHDFGLIFCQPNGKPLHAHNMVRDFRRVARLDGLRAASRANGTPEEALPKGLPRIRFHDLRHGVGTHLGKLGVPVKVIQEYLGHASPQFTLATYVHTFPAMKEDAAARLAEWLLGARSEEREESSVTRSRKPEGA